MAMSVMAVVGESLEDDIRNLAESSRRRFGQWRVSVVLLAVIIPARIQPVWSNNRPQVHSRSGRQIFL